MDVIHYNIMWNDIPSTTSGFLTLHRNTIEAQPPNAGPMVVHCRYFDYNLTM